MDADWPMIVVRFALYGVLSGLFGLSAFSLYALRECERWNTLALKPWLVGSAGLGLLLSAVALALLAASMAGTSPWPIDRDAISLLLSGSATGTAWEARMAALVVAAMVALVAAGRAFRLGLVALASGIALATLAWTGHGAMDEGTIGWVHLVADILHLLAAGAWVGALLGLILLVTRARAQVDRPHLMLTHRALHGFGAMGTIIVGTIVVTGLVNAWLLVGVGNVLTFGATPYGRLLIAKLVLFAVMLCLASLNRYRLTPAFAQCIDHNDHHAALGTLRASLAVETACIILVLGLVAWLGTLEPPASAM